MRSEFTDGFRGSWHQSGAGPSRLTVHFSVCVFGVMRGAAGWGWHMGLPCFSEIGKWGLNSVLEPVLLNSLAERLVKPTSYW